MRCKIVGSTFLLFVFFAIQVTCIFSSCARSQSSDRGSYECMDIAYLNGYKRGVESACGENVLMHQRTIFLRVTKDTPWGRRYDEGWKDGYDLVYDRQQFVMTGSMWATVAGYVRDGLSEESRQELISTLEAYEIDPTVYGLNKRQLPPNEKESKD